MIENFKHKGLAQFFEDDDRRKLPASQIDKIARILARLNEAMAVQDMRLPGYRLHPLKGELAGFWSVTVSGIGESFSDSGTAMPTMLILWTTTKGARRCV